MTARIRMDLRGDRALFRALSRFQRPAIRTKIVRTGVRAAGNVFLRAIKSLATALSRSRERRLARVAAGLKLRRHPKQPRGGVRLRVITPTRQELGITTGDHYYPAHIELGTSDTAAHPYMRRSFDERLTAAEAAMKQRMRQQIDVEWARG